MCRLFCFYADFLCIQAQSSLMPEAAFTTGANKIII